MKVGSIAGFDDRYVIHENGIVFDFKRQKVLRAYDTNGYKTVCLYKDGKQRTVAVHRLIATAFVPNPENKPQVNHKNGNKHDNSIENLEWVSASENIQHSYDELNRTPYGIGIPKSKEHREKISKTLTGRPSNNRIKSTN